MTQWQDNFLLKISWRLFISIAFPFPYPPSKKALTGTLVVVLTGKIYLHDNTLKRIIIHHIFGYICTFELYIINYI